MRVECILFVIFSIYFSHQNQETLISGSNSNEKIDSEVNFPKQSFNHQKPKQHIGK